MAELTVLWREGALCDVVLQSGEGHQLKAHKIILASMSPFFHAMFNGAGSEMVESQHRLPTGESLVTLRDVTADGLHAVLNAIYTGSIEVCCRSVI